MTNKCKTYNVCRYSKTPFHRITRQINCQGRRGEKNKTKHNVPNESGTFEFLCLRDAGQTNWWNKKQERQNPECLTRAARAPCLSAAADWPGPGLFGLESSGRLMVAGAYEALIRSAVMTLRAILSAFYFVRPRHMFFILSHNHRPVAAAAAGEGRERAHVLSWHWN